MPYYLCLQLILIMPFTLSHIAFALPIKRLWSDKISSTGLVIGSMLPDVEYYLRMRMYGTWGHTLMGIVLYELILGVLIAYIFHGMIKTPLLDHMPLYIKSKYNKAYALDWSMYFREHWVKIIVSLYLGILTHLFWDIFTHEEGYIFGINISWVDSLIGGYPIHSWLQLILSLMGMIVILGYIARPTVETVHSVETGSSKLMFWSVVFILFVIFYSIRAYVGIPEEKYWIQHMVISTSSIILALFFAALIAKLTSIFEVA